jgi:hypothetical protein
MLWFCPHFQHLSYAHTVSAAAAAAQCQCLDFCLTEDRTKQQQLRYHNELSQTHWRLPCTDREQKHGRVHREEYPYEREILQYAIALIHAAVSIMISDFDSYRSLHKFGRLCIPRRYLKIQWYVRTNFYE